MTDDNYYSATRTLEDLEQAAANVGCRVVVPENDELFIDIDTEEQYANFQKVLDVFRRHQGNGCFPIILGVSERPSRSGLPHRHIVIKLGDSAHLRPDKLMFQLMLGSDPMREALSYVRWATHSEAPTVFFEPLAEKTKPSASPADGFVLPGET